MTKKIREQRLAAKAAARRKRIITITITILIILAVVLGLSWKTLFPAENLIEESNVEVITTDTGLQYQDIEVGTGEAAKVGDTVSVHYTGWHEDGTTFDSSLTRGKPFEFELGKGSVIKGWDEGVAGMKIGGVRKLIIPPELGYGDRGSGNSIRPGETLIFEVELLDIN